MKGKARVDFLVFWLCVSAGMLTFWFVVLSHAYAKVKEFGLLP